MSRNRDIDILRAWAALLVVAMHLVIVGKDTPLAVKLFFQDTLHFGAGVDIFFVISGFVIAMALAPLWAVTTPAQAQAAHEFPLAFYRRRFFRLWPAAAFWLTINLICAVIFVGHSLWPPPGLMLLKAISGYLYMFNLQEAYSRSVIGYFWSLSVEWQFYFILPLLLIYVRQDWARLACLFGALALSVIFMPGGEGWWMFRFDGIVFGVALYVWLHRMGGRIPDMPALTNPLVKAIATIALVLGVIVFSDERISTVLASLVATVLVALAVANRNYISDLGLPRVFDWLGSRSYSLYLAHIPCGLFVDQALHNVAFTSPWIYMAVHLTASAALSLLAAEATFKLIETPSHKKARAIPMPDVKTTLPRGALVPAE